MKHKIAGNIHSIEFESTCLASNLLGDPTYRKIFVYVPDRKAPNGKFPTLTILPGFSSTHHSVLGFSPWEPNPIERLDHLISQNLCPPTIAILPDCMTRFGGSQYLDSSTSGNYQSYLVDEVLPQVDAQFPTFNSCEGRAIVGRSSGGFGALRLAMDRPGTFACIGSHAGDAAFEISMKPMLTHAAIAIDRAGGLLPWIEAIDQCGPKDAMDFDALFVLASTMAYAPEPKKKFPHVSLPFDSENGRIDPDVWEKWLAHDPLERIDQYTQELKKLSFIFLDAGNRDEHGLHFAARLMSQKMRDKDIAVHHEEFDGGHRGTSHRYEVSIPLLIKNLPVNT